MKRTVQPPELVAVVVSEYDPTLMDFRSREQFDWGLLIDGRPRVLCLSDVSDSTPKLAMQLRVTEYRRRAYRRATAAGMKAHTAWDPKTFRMTVQFYMDETTPGPNLINENSARNVIRRTHEQLMGKGQMSAETITSEDETPSDHDGATDDDNDD